MPNKDQDPATEGATANLTSPRQACQTNRDISWEREARDAALVKQVAKAVPSHDQCQPPAIPTTLKVISGANGFKVMDPFDWTRDKDIYQRWKL